MLGGSPDGSSILVLDGLDLGREEARLAVVETASGLLTHLQDAPVSIRPAMQGRWAFSDDSTTSSNPDCQITRWSGARRTAAKRRSAIA